MMVKNAVVAVLLAIGLGTANAERLRAPDGTERDVPEASVEFALKEGYTRIEMRLMRDQRGTVYEVPEPDVASMLDRGWWLMTADERSAYWSEHATKVVGDAVAEFEASERRKWYMAGAVIAGFLLLAWAIAKFGRRHIDHRN